MLTDSENAPYKYIGEDAIGLYKDVRSGAAASYVAKDENVLRRRLLARGARHGHSRRARG